jgi:putative glutamine amidotransferase
VTVDPVSRAGELRSGRPVIAIPARFSVSASALRYAAEVTSRNLLDAVWAAGGEPVVLHPHAPRGLVDDEEVAARLRIADGVLLPGGGDLAAHWSAQESHETLYDVDVEQDAFDLAAARVALAEGAPLLAICRGLQVVNVSRGGTVVQDMDTAGSVGDTDLRHHRHHRHDVKVDPGSLLADVVGETLHASCYHHQCLADLGEGLHVTARAEDGVIEAVELDVAQSWFLGVQWHPEDTWAEDAQQLAVFRALVRAAQAG